MTKKQKEKFESLSCQLSPENLTCDGELSNSEVQSRYCKLKKEWRKLEAQVGHNVSESDVWKWFFEGFKVNGPKKRMKQI